MLEFFSDEESEESDEELDESEDDDDDEEESDEDEMLESSDDFLCRLAFVNCNKKKLYLLEHDFALSRLM